MIKRSFFALFLLACAVLLTSSANAQVFVSSHTNIETNNQGKFLAPACQTVIQDADTIRLYPNAAAACTLNQNALPIQSMLCFGTNVFCTVPAVDRKPVIEGLDYQTTARHGLILQLLPNGCTQNGVSINCFSDPMNYVVGEAVTPINDQGQIFSRGGPASFYLVPPDGNSDFLIGKSAETLFLSAEVLPFIWHAKANDPPRTFRLSGNQNANWTFTGSGGTTVPAAPPTAPAQGIFIDFHAPSTVPVQQVDTLTGCKVDTGHGIDCNSAQIIVEVLGVSIPPGNPTDIPPTSNPTELLGGQTFPYKAIVTQGGRDLPNSPVTWTKSDQSGLNLIDIDPSSGLATVQPQSVFQGGDFVVSIQATSPFDPAVAFSAPFTIHIPTASVQMTTTPTPGLNEPPFEARLGRVFNFAANVTGPTNPQNRTVSWSQNINFNPFGKPGTINTDPSNPNFPNVMTYVITNPPPNGVVTTTISACAGGSVDPSGNPVNAICASYNLKLSPPVIPTSAPPTINSGESTLVTITGTGFGTAPILSFSDPTVSFTPVSVSGPDANGVTTVTGTMTAAPVPAPIPFTFKIIPVTITSSLPPPSTPTNQNVFVRPVTTSAAVTPVNPTLVVSQSQQFTPGLGCLTSGGQSCAVPQTSTCTLFSGSGTMTASCLYTAPASLAAQTQVQGRACFTFGNICTTFPINLVPVTVAVSPAAVSLRSGQSQQFQATVTNVPNNNQGVAWSINPLVGTITAAGLYTAPAVVSAAQSISVTACSVVNTTQCSWATVALVPPAFGVPFLASTNFTDAQGWNQSAYYTSLRLADVNGDGRPDLCGRGSGGMVCALNNGSGGFNAATLWETNLTDAGGWNQPQYGSTIMLGDVNGDGKADVCGRGQSGVYCELSTGTSFGAPVLSPIFTDAQGWNQAAYYTSLRLADVNGDGKLDLCGRGPGGIVCALNAGNGAFGTQTLWEGVFTDAAGWNQAPYGTTMMFADINGDGKADVCGRGGAGVYCELSTGTGFGPVYLASPDFSDAQGWNQPAYYTSLRLADVNGDGRPDLCGRGSGGIVCALNNGNGTFAPARQWEGSFTDAAGWNQAQYGTTIMFADINGDGRADVCGRAVAGILCALSVP